MTISHNGRVFLLSGGHCHLTQALRMHPMTHSHAPLNVAVICGK